jgi:hypothetical protein
VERGSSGQSTAHSTPRPEHRVDLGSKPPQAIIVCYALKFVLAVDLSRRAVATTHCIPRAKQISEDQLANCRRIATRPSHLTSWASRLASCCCRCRRAGWRIAAPVQLVRLIIDHRADSLIYMPFMHTGNIGTSYRQASDGCLQDQHATRSDVQTLCAHAHCPCPGVVITRQLGLGKQPHLARPAVEQSSNVCWPSCNLGFTSLSHRRRLRRLILLGNQGQHAVLRSLPPLLASQTASSATSSKESSETSPEQSQAEDQQFYRTLPTPPSHDLTNMRPFDGGVPSCAPLPRWSVKVWSTQSESAAQDALRRATVKRAISEALIDPVHFDRYAKGTTRCGFCRVTHGAVRESRQRRCSSGLNT